MTVAAVAGTEVRWLVVVRRDQPGLYQYLRQGFDGVRLVEVILDRRQDGQFASATRDRVPSDRRRSGDAQERRRWRSLGYLVVSPPAGLLDGAT